MVLSQYNFRFSVFIIQIVIDYISYKEKPRTFHAHVKRMKKIICFPMQTNLGNFRNSTLFIEFSTCQ